MAGLESSPGSVEEFEDSEMREEKRRQPVKRACNECRQQKVSRESVSRESQSVFALGEGGSDGVLGLVADKACSSGAMWFKTHGPTAPDAGV